MTKRNKKLREVYLATADRCIELDAGGFLCCEISETLSQQGVNRFGEARMLFVHLFHPDVYFGDETGIGQLFWPNWLFTPTEQKQNRILALLFMAELARTDSLPTLEEIQTA